jgi:hypothetical protein
MNEILLSSTTGLTVTIQLYLSGSTVGSPFSMNEVGTTGEYYANMPGGLSAGEYMLIFTDGGSKIASGYVSWDGTRELHDTWDALRVLHGRSGSYGEQVESNLDAIKSKTDLIPSVPASQYDIPTAEENASATWSYKR